MSPVDQFSYRSVICVRYVVKKWFKFELYKLVIWFETSSVSNADKQD